MFEVDLKRYSCLFGSENSSGRRRSQAWKDENNGGRHYSHQERNALDYGTMM